MGKEEEMNEQYMLTSKEAKVLKLLRHADDAKTLVVLPKKYNDAINILIERKHMRICPSLHIRTITPAGRKALAEWERRDKTI